MRRYDFVISEANVWKLPEGVCHPKWGARLQPSDSSLYKVVFGGLGDPYEAMVDRDDLNFKAARVDRDVVARVNPDATLIAIAGAPSGGKSTCARSVVDALNDGGVPAYLLPEVATSEIQRLKAAGMPVEAFATSAARLALQARFFERQLLLENQIMARAAKEHPGAKVVLVCDSGLPSGAAYTADKWNVVESMVGVRTARMLERYHGVVVLETVASHDQDLYEYGVGSNNEARYHSPRQAVEEVQPALVAVWSKHQRYRYVEAQANFDDKLDDCFTKVTELLPTKITKMLRASRHQHHSGGRHRGPG